jgi:hypothetical protein
MPDTVKVTVPDAAGPEIRVSYAGDEPITYPVKNGTVTVQAEHLADFLGAVEGSTARGDSAASEK